VTYQEFLHEFRIFAKVKHPNILPLLGFTLSDNQKPGIVTPWMSGGNLHQYLERHRHRLTIDKKLRIVSLIPTARARSITEIRHRYARLEAASTICTITELFIAI
jgi:serine/threonine protein kinase